MEFEWDEAKRQSNIEKHGIDFAEAVAIFDNYVSMYQDTRADYGEVRYVSIGLLQGVEIAVIHTFRGGKNRIISARKARVKERRMYHYERNRNEN